MLVLDYKGTGGDDGYDDGNAGGGTDGDGDEYGDEDGAEWVGVEWMAYEES